MQTQKFLTKLSGLWIMSSRPVYGFLKIFMISNFMDSDNLKFGDKVKTGKYVALISAQF